MPKSKKRSVLKVNSKLQNGTEEKEKEEKVREMYNNWRAGVESQNELLDKIIQQNVSKAKQNIDQLIFRLPPNILNMTIKDFSKMYDENYKATEQPSLETNTNEEPIKDNNIECAVDEVLKDLQINSASSDGEPKKKATRKKKRKAPPRTGKKQKVANSVMETPCNSTQQAVEDWKSTPFASLKTLPKLGLLEPKPIATPGNYGDVFAKIVFVSQTGSPVAIPDDAVLQERLNRRVKAIEKDLTTTLGKGE